MLFPPLKTIDAFCFLKELSAYRTSRSKQEHRGYLRSPHVRRVAAITQFTCATNPGSFLTNPGSFLWYRGASAPVARLPLSGDAAARASGVFRSEWICRSPGPALIALGLMAPLRRSRVILLRSPERALLSVRLPP